MVDSEVPEYQLSIPEVMKAYAPILCTISSSIVDFTDEKQPQLAQQLPQLP